MTERVSGADRCLCKDKCLGISPYLCSGLPSALAASTAAQRKWVGLTDDDIDEIYNRQEWDNDVNYDYEYAIEAKLKEKNT